MYVRNDGNQDLTFVVSGMLWQRSLVMRDEETQSLWSHILGKSMRGKLEGTQLKTIPALLTDWATWKLKHPETSVVLMSRTMNMFKREMYNDLGRFVVGMAAEEKSRAWNFSDLKLEPVVNDSFNDEPVLIYFDATSSTPFVYDRRLKDKTLTFLEKDNVTIDQQTNSTWDLKLGVATGGTLEGEHLEQLVGIPSFRVAWKKFYPASENWNRLE